MKTNYTIKNFRVFDENGVKIEINPISILTGCNSSGKSSIVKSILLFNSFLSKIKYDIENDEPIKLKSYKLDFSLYPINLLGSFGKLVNSSSKHNNMTFAYSIYSEMLSKDVDVEFVFAPDVNDELNNGYLEKITIKIDGEIFYYTDKETTELNINIIKREAVDYLYISKLVKFLSTFQVNHALDTEYKLESGVWSSDDEDAIDSTEKYHEIHNKIFQELDKFDVKRINDVCKCCNGKVLNDKNVTIDSYEIFYNKYFPYNKSIFKIDILSELDKISKTDLPNYMKKRIFKSFEDDDFLILGSNKIIEDYITSEFNTFSEYFIRYEEEYRIKSSGFSIEMEMGIPQSSCVWDSKGMITIWHSNREEKISEEVIKKEKYDKLKGQIIDFAMIYEVVMRWNQLRVVGDTRDIYTRKELISPFFGRSIPYEHVIYSYIKEYVIYLLKSLLSPKWVGNISYVASSRVDVRRLYTLEDKNDFTELLKSYFDNKRKFLGKKNLNSKNIYEPNTFMNKWIKKFGIGESISLSIDDEGLGVKIYLHKNDGRVRLLADEGYGITQLVSILLQIENAILSLKRNKETYSDIDQFIPEYLESRQKPITMSKVMIEYVPNTIAIEEPEIHLHPKYQSLLTDMFIEAYNDYNIHFIIETHSEYLIRRSQVLVAKEQYKNDEELIKNNPFKVYYLPYDGAPYDMEYASDGYFERSFGKGFFDVSSALSLDLDRIEQGVYEG